MGFSQQGSGDKEPRISFSPGSRLSASPEFLRSWLIGERYLSDLVRGASGEDIVLGNAE